MGKGQKKHGKGRLDHYYRLAKEKGYRARAAFKLLQINQKYDNFLQKSKVVIDLCAAPGSWCQVASHLCPVNSLIVGVDLDPIKPIPNVITFQEDITSDRCRAQLRQYIKTWKADAVLHDGAPNVGAAWIQDAFTQAELVLQSLKLATEFLNAGGIFVTKVFRSKDYNNLLWVFNQFFNKVEATKPPSSRNVSAEIFVVCRGYKAPQKIDPRLLDPRSVFADLADPTPNYEAKVFNPEQKKRKRQGYDENTSIGMFETCLLGEFVRAPDPIKILGSVSQLKIDPNADDDVKTLKKMPETSREILDLCSDLKVLGRKDFKNLLKWRLKAREHLGLNEDKSKNENQETVEVEPIDEEQAIDDELESFRKAQERAKKRDKRRENERKRKDIIRMQMNMLTPTDIGIDAEQIDDSVFSLKQAEKSGALQQLAKGKLSKALPATDEDDEQIVLGNQSHKRKSSQDDDDEDDDEGMSDVERAMELEEELDEMYHAYEERRQERDARYKVKKAKSARNDEWYGFKEGEQSDDEDEDDDEAQVTDLKEYTSDSDDSDSEEEFNGNLSTTLEAKEASGLSKRASLFFDQDGFKDLESDSEDELEQMEKIVVAKDKRPIAKQEPTPESESESDSGFEVVKGGADEQASDGEENWSDSERYSWHSEGGDHDIGLITAEAMTLAHELALGRQSKDQIVDETFNKYAFRDTDHLPDWFVDDERRHSKPNRPITKEAAEAIKAKLRELNARPVKKVAEAKARKKFKAAQRLEKLKKKSDVINEDSGRSEREKADAISSLMRKATRKATKTTKPRPTLVIAKGKNKGISGRPKGVKGKYKMVDGVMKKEQRALKRAAKSRK